MHRRIKHSERALALRFVFPWVVVMSLAVIAAPGHASAAVLGDGLYQLHDHRNGGLRPPLYGLRLDGLAGDAAEDYTFSFDHTGADMKMDLQVAAGTIRIFGRAYGGRDVGTTYDTIASGKVGLWEIDFTYRFGVTEQADGSITAGPLHASNNGFIKPLFSSTVPALAGMPEIDLVDFNGNATAPTFHLDTGHRTNPGVSGWGWVNHSGTAHIYSSDWLFEVAPTPVPAPGAALLAAAGLVISSRVRRRPS